MNKDILAFVSSADARAARPGRAREGAAGDRDGTAGTTPSAADSRAELKALVEIPPGGKLHRAARNRDRPRPAAGTSADSRAALRSGRKNRAALDEDRARRSAVVAADARAPAPARRRYRRRAVLDAERCVVRLADGDARVAVRRNERVCAFALAPQLHRHAVASDLERGAFLGAQVEIAHRDRAVRPRRHAIHSRSAAHREWPGSGEVNGIRRVAPPAVAAEIGNVASVDGEPRQLEDIRNRVRIRHTRHVLHRVATVHREREVVVAVRQPEVHLAVVVGPDVVDAVSGKIRSARDAGEACHLAPRSESADLHAPDARAAGIDRPFGHIGGERRHRAAHEFHLRRKIRRIVARSHVVLHFRPVPGHHRAARDVDLRPCAASAAADARRLVAASREDTSARNRGCPAVPAAASEHGITAADAGAAFSARRRHRSARDGAGAGGSIEATANARRPIAARRRHRAVRDDDRPARLAEASADARSLAAARRRERSVAVDDQCFIGGDRDARIVVGTGQRIRSSEMQRHRIASVNRNRRT